MVLENLTKYQFNLQWTSQLLNNKKIRILKLNLALTEIRSMS